MYKVKYRRLTCFYIRPLMFLYTTFSVYVWPKMSNKLDLLCILCRNFNSSNFQIWVAVGVVHAALAVSDCAMVRKVRVTNGMQKLSTEEDSLEPRQVGRW